MSKRDKVPRVRQFTFPVYFGGVRARARVCHSRQTSKKISGSEEYCSKNKKDHVMRLTGAILGWMLRKGLSEVMTYRWSPE